MRKEKASTNIRSLFLPVYLSKVQICWSVVHIKNIIQHHFFLLYLQSKSCFKPQPGNQTQCCSSPLPPTAHLTTVAKGGCRHQHPRAPRLCRLNPTLLCSQLSILALSLNKCFQTFLTCTCHCTEVKISFMKKGRKPLEAQTCMLTPDTWWCGESVQLNVITPSFY